MPLLLLLVALAVAGPRSQQAAEAAVRADDPAALRASLPRRADLGALVHLAAAVGAGATLLAGELGFARSTVNPLGAWRTPTDTPLRHTFDAYLSP